MENDYDQVRGFNTERVERSIENKIIDVTNSILGIDISEEEAMKLAKMVSASDILSTLVKRTSENIMVDAADTIEEGLRASLCGQTKSFLVIGRFLDEIKRVLTS